MSAPAVRPMREDDIPAVSAARVLAWQRAYAGIVPQQHLDSMTIAADRERRLGYFRDPDNPVQTLVGELGSSVLGFASVGPCRDDDAPVGSGEVQAIYLHPDAWGRGLGRALLGAGLALLAEQGRTPIYLWVLVGNARARRFYEIAGFVPEGAREQFTVQGGEVPEMRYLLPGRAR